jgi:TM2 domain-containing membrane protein YozV
MVVRTEKNPALAAFLSMIWVGLGHIYNGRLLTGLAFMVVYPVVTVVAWFGLFAGLAGSVGGLVAFLVWPLLWVWAAASAYKGAKRRNAEGG